jgi:hypothetical protein
VLKGLLAELAGEPEDRERECQEEREAESESEDMVTNNEEEATSLWWALWAEVDGVELEDAASFVGREVESKAGENDVELDVVHVENKTGVNAGAVVEVFGGSRAVVDKESLVEYIVGIEWPMEPSILVVGTVTKDAIEDRRGADVDDKVSSGTCVTEVDDVRSETDEVVDDCATRVESERTEDVHWFIEGLPAIVDSALATDSWVWVAEATMRVARVCTIDEDVKASNSMS